MLGLDRWDWGLLAVSALFALSLATRAMNQYRQQIASRAGATDPAEPKPGQ